MSSEEQVHPSMVPERRTMKIRQVATGLVFERYAPDAHDMVACGEFEFVDSSTVSIREVLDTKGVPELAAIGGGHVNVENEQPAHVRARLVPLVEQGVVSLDRGTVAGE